MFNGLWIKHFIKLINMTYRNKKKEKQMILNRIENFNDTETDT